MASPDRWGARSRGCSRSSRCIGIVGYVVYNRRQRRRFGFQLRPMWAEVVIASSGCGIVLALAAFANENVYPKGVATRIAEERGIDGATRWPARPDGHLLADHPAHRRRHRHDVHRHPTTLRPLRLRLRRQPRGGGPGRHQHALDDHEDVHRHGRPLRDSPAPSSSAASTAPPRTSGTTDELYVIAAAVVGGTSFAGGIGTIPGAILGAIVLAALAYGLAFMGVPVTDPEHRGRHRARRRRRFRHVQPPTWRDWSEGALMTVRGADPARGDAGHRTSRSAACTPSGT